MFTLIIKVTIYAHLLTPRMACGQFLDVASLTTLLPPLVIQYLSYKNVNLVYVNRAFDKVDFLNPQSAGRRVEKNIVSLFERRSRIRIEDFKKNKGKNSDVSHRLQFLLKFLF